MTAEEMATDSWVLVIMMLYLVVGAMQMLYYTQQRPKYSLGNLWDHMFGWPVFVLGGCLRWRVWQQVKKLKPEDVPGFTRVLGVRSIQRVDHPCQKVTYFVQRRNGEIIEYVITDWAVANLSESPRSYLRVLARIMIYGE